MKKTTTAPTAAQLEQRYQELSRELETATAKLAEARRALVAGSGSTSDVVQAQITTSALEEALQDLRGQIETAHATEAQAAAAAHRAQIVGELAAVADAANQSAQEYESALIEGQKAVEQAARRILDSRRAHAENRKKFREVGSAICPPITKFKGLGEVSQEDYAALNLLTDELKNSGVELSGIKNTAGDFHRMITDGPVALPERTPYMQPLMIAFDALCHQEELAAHRAKNPPRWGLSQAEKERQEREAAEKAA